MACAQRHQVVQYILHKFSRLPHALNPKPSKHPVNIPPWTFTTMLTTTTPRGSIYSRLKDPLDSDQEEPVMLFRASAPNHAGGRLGCCQPGTCLRPEPCRHQKSSEAIQSYQLFRPLHMHGSPGFLTRGFPGSLFVGFPGSFLGAPLSSQGLRIEPQPSRDVVSLCALLITVELLSADFVWRVGHDRNNIFTQLPRFVTTDVCNFAVLSLLFGC